MKYEIKWSDSAKNDLKNLILSFQILKLMRFIRLQNKLFFQNNFKLMNIEKIVEE